MGYDIFISYRRSDSAGRARFLHDKLSRYFDRERIFFDRESIESGDVFPDRFRQGVSEAKVALALIAPDWINVKDEKGKRRLLDPKDYVRKEIALALELGKKIIPVLIDHESFPKAKNLPKCLQNLTSCDAHVLRGKPAEYDPGVKALYRLLSKIPGMPPSKIPFMVEKLPADFVPRPEEMNQLRSLLLKREAGQPVAITAALKGAGGYGKTTLAMALCHSFFPPAQRSRTRCRSAPPKICSANINPWLWEVSESDVGSICVATFRIPTADPVFGHVPAAGGRFNPP